MKAPLEGYVYRIEQISTDKRLLLAHLLASDAVMDAVLVGESIRVNLMEHAAFPTEYLARGGERFDVVFLDPPFRQNADATLLGRLASRLEPGARVSYNFV